MQPNIWKMKIIKYLCVAVGLFFSTIATAQTPVPTTVNWPQITAARGNFKFGFPSTTYTAIDTLNTLIYSKQVDTLLSLQVHYVNNVTVSTTDSVWAVLLSQNNNDTLRAMGGFMLVLANGQLTSIQNLNPAGNNPKGLEISMICPGESTESNLIFSRLFLQNGRFHAFTVGSLASDVIRLGTYKTTFFNSISFLP
jgi:hypothetical protein